MTLTPYGRTPVDLGPVSFDLTEVMYYLYLPVRMRNKTPLNALLLPANLTCLDEMIRVAEHHADRKYEYTYVSARKGWASPDNPLNRPGWHCDGFGTDDMNYVWWAGPGTRFARQQFHSISEDHLVSLHQFEEQIRDGNVSTRPERHLYALDPYVVHATPIIEPPGCMRQYVKISLSDHRYNLENNSHNYLFDYDWPLVDRTVTRNDTHAAGRDFA